MWRKYFMIAIGLVGCSPSFSQIKKQFFIEETNRIDKVDFSFTCKSGVCFIKPAYNQHPLSIYSNQGLDDYAHTFNKEIKNRICDVDLTLHNGKGNDFSTTISSRMFNDEKKSEQKLWKVYLAQNTSYRLDLKYGMEDAHIDLSGLKIENLKIKSGNADVNIGYTSGLSNKVEMDTFYVKVGMGSVNVEQMGLSRSKKVIADVGFGNLSMDFSQVPINKSDISASVGAGNLIIILPEKGVPAIVRVNNSMLCKVRLSNSFHEISDNVFINESYAENADNLLSFNVDVSLGRIVFKETKD